MSERAGVVAGAALRRDTREVEGALVDMNGRRFYRIANHDAMPPFFMSLVSDSDHWLFASSNGALTAGRRDPDRALFPYYTDDRIHDSQDQTGAKTLLRAARGGKVSLWEPFSSRYDGLYGVERNLYKSTVGNELVFEETNADLELVFRYSWTSSERFGFVRSAALRNTGKSAVQIEVLDGVQNLLPAGLGRRFQLEYSTLADGYKEAELDATTGLGIFRLSSVPIDKAEPSEALRATTAWSLGLEPAIRLLSATQLDRFRRGLPVDQETNVRGRRGGYFVQGSVALAKGGEKEWLVVCDVEQDAAAVRATLANLTKGEALLAEVDADVERGRRNLGRIVASADGLQATDDELSAGRHFSNVLFNVMRGGVPDRGYEIARDDLASFLRKANRRVAERQAAFVSALPETLPHGRLLALAREQGDPDLERLTHEYLPLTFSRRHGDPSRPWNVFAIEVKDEHGQKILNYQGNWRDIFQNWEALALSFPGYVESMVFKFLDASTADGHNPYRVMRDGFDWEVVDPHDPWSHIGYWGDHQVVYLLRLLEASRRYHPGAIEALLGRRVFGYADVPYRIKPYERLLLDPHQTIDFDWDAHRAAMRRVAELGGDGRSLPDGEGGLYRATLAEKLLVVALAKLFNFVPEAGIWMNTQRPEWNDANNALVGYGVSMVTLYYLRRFVALCRQLFAGAGASGVEVSAEIAGAFRAVSEALARHEGLLGGAIPDQDRKRVLDDLGRVGSAYRQRVYAGLSGERHTLAGAELEAFCARTLRHLDHSIRANRRADGLYHSYNLMKVEDDSKVVVRRLYEMLEGQVAVLASGALTPEDGAALLDRLAASPLYRADQRSYILYPDRRLPRFLEKNNIPIAAVAGSRLLNEMLKRDDRRIVVKDVAGGVHFNAAFRSARLLREALEALRDGELGALAEEETRQLLALYEELFDHQSFTGRSGTFYKYEGLGCIYWHMVSKLLLAVQDLRADGTASATVRRRLQEHYEAIREGIGVHKTPTEYGAIPTDPYSHTPGFAGVQQPGMTGQVKEDILSRFAEMGASVEEGRLVFRADRFRVSELRTRAGRFEYVDLDGEPRGLDLPKGSLAFTTCQVPVVVHDAGPAKIELTLADGSSRQRPGLELDAETSAAIFERTGRIRRVDVFFGLA